MRVRGKLSPKAWVFPVPERVCLQVLEATSKSSAPVEGTEKRWPVDKNPLRFSQGSLRRSTPIHAFVRSTDTYLLEKAESNTGWIFPLPDEARVYGYQGEIKHFVECVARGEMPRETFEDGYIVNVIMDAAYRSMR